MGGIYGQRFNKTSVKAGTEFQINVNTANSQTNPSVASLGGDRFVVTWTSNEQDGSLGGVYGALFPRSLTSGMSMTMATGSRTTSTLSDGNIPVIAGLAAALGACMISAVTTAGLYVRQLMKKRASSLEPGIRLDPPPDGAMGAADGNYASARVGPDNIHYMDFGPKKDALEHSVPDNPYVDISNFSDVGPDTK